MYLNGEDNIREKLVRYTIGHGIDRPLTPTKYDEAYEFMKEKDISFDSMGDQFNSYADERTEAEERGAVFVPAPLRPAVSFGSHMPTMQRDDTKRYTNTVSYDPESYKTIQDDLMHRDVERLLSDKKYGMLLPEQVAYLHKELDRVVYNLPNQVNDDLHHIPRSITKGTLRGISSIYEGVRTIESAALSPTLAKKLIVDYVSSRVTTEVFLSALAYEGEENYALRYLGARKALSEKDYKTFLDNDISRRKCVVSGIEETISAMESNGIEKTVDLIIEHGVKELVYAGGMSFMPAPFKESPKEVLNLSDSVVWGRAIKKLAGSDVSAQQRVVSKAIDACKFTKIKDKDASKMLEAFHAVRASGIADQKKE